MVNTTCVSSVERDEVEEVLGDNERATDAS